jgi:NADH dehydrogenase [ubiquinone] 1 alpha subcomplex assembly factor 1
MEYSPTILYDFKPDCSLSDWKIVDDTVMGGRSSGNFSISENGTGLFDGSVSLENNGGFSSVRHRAKSVSLVDFDSFILKLKGDGKSYQFRVKDDVNSYYSYKTEFSTNGDWQEIQLKFSNFTPTYRGRTLNIPNFSGTSLEEMTFLIANKENENFRLELDELSVQ